MRTSGPDVACPRSKKSALPGFPQKGSIMRCWSFFLLIAALGAQTGEITTREETPTFQSSVNLVRVPVVVRDKQGNTVGSFHKEDFQLTDRGKPQSIAQFTVEGSAVSKAAAQPPAHAPVQGEPAAEGSKLVVPTRFVEMHSTSSTTRYGCSLPCRAIGS